jgi:hypothetical protein
MGFIDDLLDLVDGVCSLAFLEVMEVVPARSAVASAGENKAFSARPDDLGQFFSQGRGFHPGNLQSMEKGVGGQLPGYLQSRAFPLSGFGKESLDDKTQMKKFGPGIIHFFLQRFGLRSGNSQQGHAVPRNAGCPYEI